GKEIFICAVNPSEREYTLEIEIGEVLISLNVDVERKCIVLKPISYIWAIVNSEIQGKNEINALIK
ncbi:MAG: hypothetical protein IJZ34_06830, partial [Lachnospiraceae bacterium]|nr:hypothetical protein [Lachnospiraceae bacterium]